MVKGTYTLDIDTVRTLDALARKWGTSKYDVLRRAVRAAATAGSDPGDLAALDRLQHRAKLTAAKAGRWAEAVRAERRTR